MAGTSLMCSLQALGKDDRYGKIKANSEMEAILKSAIFLGVKGCVIALDRASGQQLWSTSLKGSDFVNVTVDGDLVIATVRGEVFGLDATGGKVLWHNELPGMGWGIISIATADGASSAISPVEQKRRTDEEAGAIAGATG